MFYWKLLIYSRHKFAQIHEEYAIYEASGGEFILNVSTLSQE